MISGHSRSGKIYITMLCVGIMVMMGAVLDFASANDATPAPVSEVTTSTPKPVKTPVNQAKKSRIAEVAEKAKLSPAAGSAVSPMYADGEYDVYGQAEDSDPLEPLNRSIFQFNYAVDKVLIRPVTVAYRGVVPPYGRTMVSNFIDNLYTPVTFANSILQADPYNSFASFWRFFINTTFGIGGLFDVASEAGLDMRTTDMGLTFAMHGGDAGPYFVIPLVGPSSIRDALGRIGDAFLTPSNYFTNATSFSVYGATAINVRSRNMKTIDDVYRTSLDPYATFRSAFMQKRKSDVRKAKEARDESLAKAASQ